MKRLEAIADRFVKNLHYYDYIDEIKEETDETNGTNGTKTTVWKLPYEYSYVAELTRSAKTGNSLLAINAREKNQRIRARMLLNALGLDDIRIDAKGQFIQDGTVLAHEILYLNARTLEAINDATREAAYNYMLAEQFLYGNVQEEIK